jgi:hypothetical protein
MRSLDVATVVLTVSFAANAAEPAPVPPPPRPTPVEIVREQPVVRVVRPPRPPKSTGRFVQRRLGRPFAGEGTPIVFSSRETVTLRADDGVFEFEPGVPVRSAWPDAQTAWLVNDLDGDGQITSGRELFGSFTLLGERRAKHGFEALAALDADGDGVVDVPLQLWFDVDGDRRVSDGELRPAPRIPVAFETVSQCDARGNCVRERARLTGGWLLDLHLRMEVVQPRLSSR